MWFDWENASEKDSEKKVYRIYTAVSFFLYYPHNCVWDFENLVEINTRSGSDVKQGGMCWGCGTREGMCRGVKQGGNM